MAGLVVVVAAVLIVAAVVAVAVVTATATAAAVVAFFFLRLAVIEVDIILDLSSTRSPGSSQEWNTHPLNSCRGCRSTRERRSSRSYHRRPPRPWRKDEKNPGQGLGLKIFRLFSPSSSSSGVKIRPFFIPFFSPR